MKHEKRSIGSLLVVVIVLFLTGCGFKLRGQFVLPPGLRCLRLESCTPYGDFESTLRQKLIEHHVNVTRTRSAPIIFHVIRTSVSQDVPTIGGSNQARVYVYYYCVIFELLDGNHQRILGPKTVTASNTLIVNAGTALESTHQLQVLQYEMQKEAVMMIINILTSPQVWQLTSTIHS